MSRVKKGVNALKRRRSMLSQVKGYRFGRGTKERQAHEAIVHAGMHAFAHRRDKKADARKIWQISINSAVRPLGLSYSRFIDGLKKKNIGLDRKILAHLAENNPKSFEHIVKSL